MGGYFGGNDRIARNSDLRTQKIEDVLKHLWTSRCRVKNGRSIAGNRKETTDDRYSAGL